MTRREYEEYFATRGIDLEDYKVIVGYKTNMPDCMGCYCENGVWKIYETDDRQHISIRFQGTEEEMFEEFLGYTNFKIGLYNRANGR